MVSKDDLERLFREAGPTIWRVMCGVTGGRKDIAEEAVAEAFARAMQHSTEIRDPLPWIYRTAFRVARDELRREGRTNRLEPNSVSSADLDRLQDLMRALRSLSPNQRAAVILHYEEDMPVDAVARVLGMAPSTVRVHLYRGRRNLQRLLASEEVPDA